MDSTVLEAKFEKMGARVKVRAVRPQPVPRSGNGVRFDRFREPDTIRINILRDDRGEYFDLAHRSDVRVDVLDIRKDDRHLLLRATDGADIANAPRFLCGHDERAWFVAAIPESAAAANVQNAKDALKPQEVWDAIREHKVHPKDRDKRHTKAFVRQGEWFFIPRPELKVAGKAVLQNEPIRRGSGKPHMCQLLYRIGGEVVYVNASHPNGLTFREYSALAKDQRTGGNFRPMQRDAKAYARGRVRHSDHATIVLDVWHQVVMNTETRAAAMANVAFLD